jgi:hypothetical protein
MFSLHRPDNSGKLSLRKLAVFHRGEATGDMYKKNKKLSESWVVVSAWAGLLTNVSVIVTCAN